MSSQSDNTIYYWPDGTWCYAFEYSEVAYAFKGDDYVTLDVSTCENEREIDRMVDSIFFMNSLQKEPQDVP